MSTIELTDIMAVIPLRKPGEKLWTKKSSERGKESQIKTVLAKFEEAGKRKNDLSSLHRRVDEKETDIRPTISSGLNRFARESLGM